MDILETNKLVLFLAFVMPGFISIKVYNLLYKTNLINSSEMIIDAITYSSINYALWFVPIGLIENNKIQTEYPVYYTFFYGFILLVSPILLAYFWGLLREKGVFQNKLAHPISKPWDYVFKQRKQYWVLIKLKNGEFIGGKYASASFTSSYPAEEQIYLEETWVLNKENMFERPVEKSAGIIIMSNEISYVELFQY